MTVLIVLAVLAGMIAVVLVAGQLGRRRLARQDLVQGQLIDIGERQLNVVCRGTGGPTVVLEAGLGDFSPVWSFVEPAISADSAVVTYDRAGYGGSDPATDTRTLAEMAADLERILDLGAYPRPYVLVGHSFGGILVREVARRRPDLVGGMVLVDSSHEQQFERFPPEVLAAARPMLGMMRRMSGLLRMLARTGLVALIPALASIPAGLPAPARAAYHAARGRDGRFVDAYVREQELAMEDRAGPPVLGDVPLVVLTHGRAERMPGQSAALAEAQERAWRAMQAELAGISTRGRLEVAEGAGHYIHLERPELVVDAIREVLSAMRSSADPR